MCKDVCIKKQTNILTFVLCKSVGKCAICKKNDCKWLKRSPQKKKKKKKRKKRKETYN